VSRRTNREISIMAGIKQQIT